MGLIMLFVTSITFFIVRLLPGDPVFMLVGDHPTEEQIENAKNEYGLNEPIYKQYMVFLQKTIMLDLGVSLRTKQPVLVELSKRFSATFELVFFSMIIALLFGFPMGLVSALKQNKRIDYFFRGFGYLGLSIPVFLAWYDSTNNFFRDFILASTSRQVFRNCSSRLSDNL